MNLSIPTTPWSSTVFEVLVDPRFGSDASAAVGVGSFRTLGAAASALGAVVDASGADVSGLIRLLPGTYGPDVNMSGDTFPIAIPPRVSVVGADATSVIIRADLASSSGAPGIPLPTAMQRGSVRRRPAFIFGSMANSGYEHTLLARMTITGAEVGVLIGGQGSVSPTIAECLFVRCVIGIQIHSEPLASAPTASHRPLVLWNTFGECETGILQTGAPRAIPSIANCLIDALAPLEGVACNSVTATAFAAGTANRSGFIGQPAANPQPVFDLAQYDPRDLFVGAAVQAASAPLEFFSDWRPTFLTRSGHPNPMLSVGRVDFPFQAGNGTWARLPFPGFELGGTSSEGPGTSGPVLPTGGTPGSTTGGHVGFRSGGSFVIGGTIPGERRFGTGPGNALYDRIHLHFDPSLTPIALMGVVHMGSPFGAGSHSIAPFGVLEEPVVVPGLGPSHLDPGMHWRDFDAYLAPMSAQNVAVITTMLPPPGTPESTYVLQGLAIDARTLGLVTTDAQYFMIGGD